jgi:hypothetical protein
MAQRVTKRMTADLPKSSKNPLIIYGKSVKRLALEDAPEDYEEFDKIILWRRDQQKKPVRHKQTGRAKSEDPKLTAAASTSPLPR